ncbi:MAG: hypothetical protein Q8Q04_03775 [archaeon]|nr:hypothetical protein [archaeon]
MRWYYWVPLFFILLPQKSFDPPKEIPAREELVPKPLEKKDSSFAMQYKPSFELEQNGIFYRHFSMGYILNWSEVKKDFGKGPRWYVQAAYDFNGDSQMDKLAFFRIINYDFEKNIPGTKPWADLVFSDENKDGFPDKIFYDNNENGTLEKMVELPKNKELYKAS